MTYVIVFLSHCGCRSGSYDTRNLNLQRKTSINFHHHLLTNLIPSIFSALTCDHQYFCGALSYHFNYFPYQKCSPIFITWPGCIIFQLKGALLKLHLFYHCVDHLKCRLKNRIRLDQVTETAWYIRMTQESAVRSRMLVLAFEKEMFIEWQGQIAWKCESNHRLTHHTEEAGTDELIKQPTISSDKQKTDTQSMRDTGTERFHPVNNTDPSKLKNPAVCLALW